MINPAIKEAVWEAEIDMLSGFGLKGPDYGNLTPWYLRDHNILDPIKEFTPIVGRLIKRPDTPWPLRMIEITKQPNIGSTIIVTASEAEDDDVGRLLSKLADAGLSDPSSPYAEEGRRQMKDALTRLSHVMKQIGNQKIEADVEQDVQEITEAAKALGFTIREDPEALDLLRQELREQLYRRLP